MRLVCLHADTIDALKRLHVEFDDLTPSGLWSSQYHLIGLTLDQFEALELFQVEAEDVTPAQLAQTVSDRPKAPAGEMAPGDRRPTPTTRPETAAGAEAEVPLAQTRDTGSRVAEAKVEPKTDTKPDDKTTTQTAPSAAAQTTGAQGVGGQPAGQKGAAKSAPAQVAPPAQGNRKGQPPAQGGGQRYGTTRLRISVAGKYTEATVANGKIVVAGRSFDTPDQAAAELTKSRGDWTFWEYYDSADGKWRMLTRDWDTVLKSAAPGGR
jgi:hypothetical protein